MNAMRRVQFSISSVCRAAAGAALLALSACGGGDPEGPAPGGLEQAAAAESSGRVVQSVKTRDNFSYANYFEFSNDCQSFAVEVFASKSLVKTNGSAAPSARVFAQYSSFDACSNEFAFMSGANETGAIKFRNDLSHASAKASVVMEDGLGGAKTVVVDLAWDGGELTIDQKNKTVNVTPVSRTVIKAIDQLRMSEAVTGALVLDGTDLLAAARPPGNRGISGFVVGSKTSTIEVVRDPH